MHTNTESTQATFTILNDESLIIISGSDAKSFLQGQLTSDVAALKQGSPQLSGYCNVKGRLYATFVLNQVGDDIHMIVPSDIAETVRKRLSMFVMRAKVKLEFAPNALIIGLTESFTSTVTGVEAFEIPAPHGLLSRFLLVAQGGVTPIDLLSDGGFSEISLAHWRDREINAGICRVGAAISEQFVPQMLNFELLGAVSFTKGCYPGQEVVARSQYLGKMKRRTFLMQVNGDTQAIVVGQDVSQIDAQAASTNPIVGQVVGQIVGVGSAVALIEISTETFALAQTHAIALTANGAALTAMAQPYPLPVHEPVKRVL